MEYLDVQAVLFEQRKKREAERDKIHEIAGKNICGDSTTEKENEVEEEGETEKKTVGSSLTSASSHSVSPTRQKQQQQQQQQSAAPCHSPTEDHAAMAQLKARVTMLEDETQSLNAVLSLARREIAVMKHLLVKVADSTVGTEWSEKLGVKIEEQSILKSSTETAYLLTNSQRERLIDLLGPGEKLHLLP